MSERRRIVITGLGAITPLGNSVKETWGNIIEGKSGVTRVTRFDPSNFTTQIGATVSHFNADDVLSPKDQRKMDMFIQFGLAAAKEAIADANLDINKLNLTRCGVAVGSGIGGLPFIEASHEKLEQSGPRRVSPFFIPGAIINMVSGQISIQHGFQGPNISIVTACTTGTHNLGHAARMIAYGDADLMLAGGAEMASTPLGLAGFASVRALSTRNDEPEKASRPWDKDRDGFVLGEGAGVLVLEEYEHAKQRGATIYAEVAGFGMSGDAYHMTAPEETGQGAKLSMEHALHDAGMNPSDVDHINAHGTSTPAGDVIEARAIKQCFGDHAYKVAISSTKSSIGHLLGAAGAVEAAFSALAIRDQIAPPTINLDNPDLECDLDFVPHTARNMDINVVMSNSFGFGGTNGTLVFKKV